MNISFNCTKLEIRKVFAGIDTLDIAAALRTDGLLSSVPGQVTWAADRQVLFVR